MKRFVLAFAVLLLAVPALADFAGLGFSHPPGIGFTCSDNAAIPVFDNATRKWGCGSVGAVSGDDLGDATASDVVALWTTCTGYLKSDGSCDTPTGSGTVTGPATATEDNIVTWGADNATLKDSGHKLSEYATLVSPSFTTPTLGVATATSLDTGFGANELYDMDQHVLTTSEVTFAKVTAGEFVSSAADGEHALGAVNSGDNTTALPEGHFYYDNTTKKFDVNVNGTMRRIPTSADYKYYRINIPDTATSDNVIIDGPVEYAQVWDNVLIVVQDNTGKLSGAATDNVTVNLSYCSSISAPTCTNVFTADQTATGAAILTPALNNTAPSAGDYIRVTISAANMTNKKVYIRARYRE